jgi:sulfur-carrier protein adenylyltransferase/sulfurtransferase
VSRYARQVAVPELGPDGQARLGRSRVLVVGTGGLAAPVRQYLDGEISFVALGDPEGDQT